jgi:hypothetical protein
MHPLLPLLPQPEEKSSEIVQNSADTEEKKEVPLIESREERIKSPELQLFKPVAVLSMELTDSDLEGCSTIFFFIRNHPEIIIDLAKCCSSHQVW